MIGSAGENLSASTTNSRTTVRPPVSDRNGAVELDELKVTRYEVSRAVATITLDRPERLNAWTGRMNTEYRSLLAQGGRRRLGPGHRRDRRRAGLLRRSRHPGARGTRRARCATTPGPDRASRVPGFGVRPEFDAEFAYHFGIPKPIIAAVNGAAAGVGFALACYCDLRFAAAGAKLTTAHGRLGLPAEFGLSWLVPRLVGLTRAADILLSSRVVLAEEAAEIGLVNEVTPPDELLGTRLRATRTRWRPRSLRRRWPPPSSSCTPTSTATPPPRRATPRSASGP